MQQRSIDASLRKNHKIVLKELTRVWSKRNTGYVFFVNVTEDVDHYVAEWKKRIHIADPKNLG